MSIFFGLCKWYRSCLSQVINDIPYYDWVFLNRWVRCPWCHLFLNGQWGSHFFCQEGATKVTALDECLLASIKVHLIAISLILVQEGVGDITSSDPFPLVSPGLVISMALILLTLLSCLIYVQEASNFLLSTPKLSARPASFNA